MDLLMKMRYYASTTIAGRSVSVLHVEANKSEARAEASRLLMVNQVSALIVGPGVDKVEDVIALARTRESPIIILDELADEAQAGPAILLGPSPTTRGKTLAEYGLTIGKNARVEVDTNDRIACSVASAFTTAWREGGGAIVESDANVHLLAIPLERFQAGLQAAPLDVQPPILYGGPDGTLNVPPGYTIVEATARSELAERSEEAIAWEQAYRKRFQQAPSRRACLAYEGLSAVLKGLEKTQGSPYGKLRDQITKEATRTLFLVRHAQGKRSLLKTIPAPEQ
jgi:ABC-type branched-subunit amino acid transport system substrate-binding protein